MATEVPEDKLEAVMERADIGTRTRKKLRDANQTPPATRGHGAPGENRLALRL